MPTDLSSLSPAEREVLRLLAQGHTAKSVAAATGRTEGAVNERLREARRKTGVGSSRELARMLAQKDRDEEIGVVRARTAAPVPAGIRPWMRWQGLPLMLLVPAGLIAAALLTMPGSQETAPDPLFAEASRNWGLSPASIRAAMAGEPRDAPWADRSEAALRHLYGDVQGVDPATLRIVCRRSWCEVLGQSASGGTEADLRTAARRLGSEAFRNSLVSEGLHGNLTGTTSDAAGGTYRFALVAYWRRTPA